VGDQLAELVAAGIARAPDGRAEPAAFDPGGPWAAAIGEINAQYPRRRTSIIRWIFTPGASDMQSFSDAFRLRPGEDDEEER
jgi:hypothetical protein